jgi:hypothetical protein
MHFTGYRETHVECTGERVYVCTGPIPGRFPSEPPGVLSGDVNSLFQGLGHVVLVDVAGDEAVLNQLLQSVEPLLKEIVAVVFVEESKVPHAPTQPVC